MATNNDESIDKKKNLEEQQQEERPESSSSSFSVVMASNNNSHNNSNNGNSKFCKGQRVYAQDEESGILYDATVRRVMKDDETDEWYYFVHYMGWNCKWDRWCPEQNVFEISDKTTELAKKLQDCVREAKKKHGRRSTQVMVELEQRMKQLQQEQRLEERRQELAKQGIAMQEQDEQEFLTTTSNANGDGTKKYTKRYFQRELELRQQQDLQQRGKRRDGEKLVLPFALKKVLVEEWEVITQCNMVPVLPARVPIRTVLDKYLSSKIGQQSVNDTTVSPIAAAAATSTNYISDAETMERSRHDDDNKDSSPDSGHAVDDCASTKEGTATASQEEEEETTPTSQDVVTSSHDANIQTELDTVVKDNDGLVVTKEVEQEWQDMVDGIALLFDQAVGSSRLLYRQELPILQWIQQHEEMSQLRYCQVFGCEYLLRLFVRLPALLADHLSDTESRPIYSKLFDMVRFLEQHHGGIFLQTYQTLVRKEQVSRKRPAPREGVSAATNKKNAKRGRKSPTGANVQQGECDPKETDG